MSVILEQRWAQIATLSTALTQALLVTLGAWAIGLDSPVLLGAVSGFLALTPIGPPLVYVPASVWLILQGQIVGGLWLGWGIFVVSMADPAAIALLLTPWRDWTAAR